MIKINLKSSIKTDPLWNLKKEILKVLKSGPMALCQLEFKVMQTRKIVLRALKDMKAVGVVQIRRQVLEGQDFEMWGIAIPDFSEMWIRLKSIFSKRRTQ